MALKYTDNTSPTWDEVKGVETYTNAFINSHYDAKDDVYKTIDFDSINLDGCSNAVIRNADGTTKKHPDTNEPLMSAVDDNGDPIELPIDALNALRLKSHIVDTNDNEITFVDDYMYSNQFPKKLIVGAAVISMPINDSKRKDENGEETDKIDKGMKSLTEAGEVTIRTYEANGFGFERKELIWTGNPD
tara:strand:+ start:89 stop:655 length:567 start_codon:yes stop_codon:yes gene_type:complete